MKSAIFKQIHQDSERNPLILDQRVFIPWNPLISLGCRASKVLRCVNLCSRKDPESCPYRPGTFFKMLVDVLKKYWKIKIFKISMIFFTFTQILPKSMHFGVESLYYSSYSLSPARFDLLYQKITEILKFSIFQYFFSTSTSILKKVPRRYGHDSGSLREHKLTQRSTFEALGELVNKIR